MPESQAYMDLLTFEQKLDATITRKRLEIQEAIRRPMKQKRKLRVFISHHFIPGEAEVILISLVCNYTNAHCTGGAQVGTES